VSVVLRYSINRQMAPQALYAYNAFSQPDKAQAII